MSVRGLAALVLYCSTVQGIDNGLGLTPPMGWRSWNCYHGDVDQAKMQSVMDRIASRGRMVDGKNTSLADLGYVDVGLDDNWQACGAGVQESFHDADGRPIIDLKKFPDMKKMTDHAHGLGLTAGWYMNNCICSEQMFKSQEYIAKHMKASAAAVAEFGFDGVKLDGCGQFLNLTWWAELLNATGRPIMIENCHWGKTTPGGHSDGSAESSESLLAGHPAPQQSDAPCKGTTTPSDCPYNFFRTSMDIGHHWEAMMKNLLSTKPYQGDPPLARPGAWAYPDMLEVGNMASYEEDRSHFGAWVITSCPLILSFDVNNEKMTDKVWDIITNKEAIAINQAWAGHPGRLLKSVSADNGSLQMWTKPVGAGRLAVLIISDTTGNHTVDVTMKELQITGKIHVRCIWGRKDLGEFEETFKTDPIGPHDSRLYVLTPPSASEIVV